MVSCGVWLLCGASLLQLGRCRRLQFQQEEIFSTHHVKNLCAEQVINDACETLGVTEAQTMSPAHLEESLAASSRDVELLLRRVFDNQFSAGMPIGVRPFCERVVSLIPKILGTAIPSAPWLACVDDECGKEDIDVSLETLRSSDLISPSPDEADVDPIEPTTSDAPEPSSPEERVQDLLRAVLNVAFGIFPAPTVSSAFKPEFKLNLFSLSTDVFTRQTSSDEQYRTYIAKAAAWIASAIRRLKSGRRMAKKWFNLRTELEIDEQLNVTRRHLTDMLAVTGRVFIEKGVHWKQGGLCRGSSLAYVRQFAPWPSVMDFHEVGEKRGGRYVIHICDYFWTGGLSEAALVGTIVHESSHHFGTVDKGYCDKINCLKLAPEDARNNADSYAYFVKDLVQSVDEDVPDPACNTLCDPISFEGGKLGEWRFDTRLPEGSCGDCQERRHVVFAGVTLKREVCGEDELAVSRDAYKQLCCKVYNCTASLPKVVKL